MNSVLNPEAPEFYPQLANFTKMGETSFIGAKNVPRPQLMFKDKIDNSESLWVPKISDKPNSIKPLSLKIVYDENDAAVGYEHPYAVELDLYDPSPQFMEQDKESPEFPPPLEETQFTLVETEQQLDLLIEHLSGVEELAVDVEHHSYRSYQGITCIIQISTNEGGDFVIDTLAIREHVHKLNVIFTDPKKLKIFHGAENDVLWLQRDFGIYIVGLFDTYQAAKALSISGLSLKNLLKKYCNLNADKTHQLADWRIRPLPETMIEYARIDTHYLLYVWRAMKNDLLTLGNDTDHHLRLVFESSRQICRATYKKEVIHDLSHMSLYLRSMKMFNARQLHALKMLYKWRDSMARELDEGVSYLVPNHMLIKIAELLPREVQGILACCSPVPSFVQQNLLTINKMMLACWELPIESQIYETPSNDEVSFNMPDLDPYIYYTLDLSDFPDQCENTSLDYDSLLAESNVYPDILVFKETEEEKSPKTASKLNADAKMFIPPYERYTTYKMLTQGEELKDFKDKEEKVLAISKGNELITEQVVTVLQQAQTQIAQETDSQTTDEPQKKTASDAKGEENSNGEPKIAQRKRKIANDKSNVDNNSVTPTEPCVDKVSETVKAVSKEVKPYKYNNLCYKKFYNESNLVKDTKKYKK